MPEEYENGTPECDAEPIGNDEITDAVSEGEALNSPEDTEPLSDDDGGAESSDTAFDADGAESCSEFEALAAVDLAELKSEFPELRRLSHIAELENGSRYAALRELGLTPREAYLATSRGVPDGRAHLSPAMPKPAGVPERAMSSRLFREARELFSDMSDGEIRALYKRVTE